MSFLDEVKSYNKKKNFLDEVKEFTPDNNTTIGDNSILDDNSVFNNVTTSNIAPTTNTTSLQDSINNRKNGNTFVANTAPVTTSTQQSKNESFWDDIIGTAKNIGRSAASTVTSLGSYLNRLNDKFSNRKDDMEEYNKKSIAESLIAPTQEYANTDSYKNKEAVFSKFVSSGNKDDISRQEVLDYINDDIDTDIQNEADAMTNPVSKFVGGTLAPVITKSVTADILSGGIAPLSTIIFGGSAADNYYKEGKNRGMDNNQSLLYSSIMGAVEGATNELTLGNAKKVGSLVTGATNKVASEASSSTLRETLKTLGVNIAENAFQEAITDPIQEATAQVVAGKGKTEGLGQQMLQDAVNGGLVAAIMGGTSIGISSCQNIIDKSNNKKSVSQEELKTAIQDAKNNGIDVEQNIKDNIQQVSNDSTTRTNEEGRTANLPQQTDNLPIANKNGINSEGKSNNTIDYENNLNKLLKNSGLSDKDKSTFKEYINNTEINDKTYNEIKDNIMQTSKANDDIILNTKQNYNNGRKENYIKYKNDNSEYDSSSVDQALEVIRANSSGRRTKDQWINIANQIGTDISNKSNEEIEKIAYKSWNDLSPNQKDNLNRQGQKYVKFTSDDWINAIYNSVKGTRDNIQYEIPEQSINKNSINNSDLAINKIQKNNNIPIRELTYDEQLNKYNIDSNNETIKQIKEATDTRGIKLSYNLDEFTNNNEKVRKHYESIINSNQMTQEAKQIAKELMGSDTYVPESNKQHIEEADRRIGTNGADNELNSFNIKLSHNEKIDANDIAVGERLIQYYSKTGNKEKLQEAIQTTAMAGSEAGRTVQAMSLLNHQTPEGQVTWIQRSIDKVNQDLVKQRGDNSEQFNFTADMQQKILNSKGKEELENNINSVYEELGQQVSKSTIEKVDAWRYFSMLTNPKTHIRNILGNVAMSAIQKSKNKVAGAIESMAGLDERTHTVKIPSKEAKDFAEADIKNVSDRLGLNENKYNPKSRLENSMRTFKSDVLENTLGKAFKLNDNLLEAEDGWGLKAGYKNALAEYMTANNLTKENITDAQLAKARNYAVEEAKKATFHQESALASVINEFSKKNKLTKFASDAIAPFVKTPINVAKTGLEYNPAGLIKSLTYDTVQLRKGNITANTYIDNISKGLTGSGIALLGYTLAKCGVLKASGSDDEDKENYDEAQGKQAYSITIGDNTYSLDWLSPSGIPLFVGAELYSLANKEVSSKEKSSNDATFTKKLGESAANLASAMTTSANPMSEMSMLSGLSSALKSYSQGDTQFFEDIALNSGKSLVNQFVPTLLGQIARTTDDKERSSTSTQTDPLLKTIDQTKNQIMNKVPGLRQLLPVRTDIWGNDVNTSSNIGTRVLENSIFPWTRKEVTTNETDKEITDLYNKTGEKSIIPDSYINKTMTIDSEKYRLTDSEYAQYKKTYGETAYNLAKDLTSSEEYKNMTDEEKIKALSNIYTYANEKNKQEYANNNNLTMKQSTMYKTINQIENNGGNASSYFKYLGLTDGLNKDSEKINALYNSSLDTLDKKTIYENTVGKDDSLYQIMKKTNININNYLDYKLQKFNSDYLDDGTEKGKAISGSKAQKAYDYINNSKLNYNQRLLLLGTQYKLNTSERSTLADYIDNLKISSSDKNSIYKKLKGFTVYNNGKISY